MAIAFAATIASAIGLYRLIRMDANRETARRGVLVMSVFPTAFSLVAPYSEAVFLAFGIWAFLFARQGRWREAGLCAFFAGLARIHGVFLLPALAVEYWLTRRRIGRDAAWLLLGAGGPIVYLAINFATFGDPLYFLGIQSSVFHVSTTAPWTGLWNAVQGALRRPAHRVLGDRLPGSGCRIRGAGGRRPSGPWSPAADARRTRCTAGWRSSVSRL